MTSNINYSLDTLNNRMNVAYKISVVEDFLTESYNIRITPYVLGEILTRINVGYHEITADKKIINDIVGSSIERLLSEVRLTLYKSRRDAVHAIRLHLNTSHNFNPDAPIYTDKYPHRVLNPIAKRIKKKTSVD